MSHEVPPVCLTVGTSDAPWGCVFAEAGKQVEAPVFFQYFLIFYQAVLRKRREYAIMQIYTIPESNDQIHKNKNAQNVYGCCDYSEWFCCIINQFQWKGK